MDIQKLLQCDCNPGKTYRTGTTFEKHLMSKRHMLFEQDKNRTEIYKRLQDMEIELFKYKEECKIWKHKYMELKKENEFYDCH
jgi:hypothetical protein